MNELALSYIFCYALVKSSFDQPGIDRASHQFLGEVAANAFQGRTHDLGLTARIYIDADKSTFRPGVQHRVRLAQYIDERGALIRETVHEVVHCFESGELKGSCKQLLKDTFIA